MTGRLQEADLDVSFSVCFLHEPRVSHATKGACWKYFQYQLIIKQETRGFRRYAERGLGRAVHRGGFADLNLQGKLLLITPSNDERIILEMNGIEAKENHLTIGRFDVSACANGTEHSEQCGDE